LVNWKVARLSWNTMIPFLLQPGLADLKAKLESSGVTKAAQRQRNIRFAMES